MKSQIGINHNLWDSRLLLIWDLFDSKLLLLSEIVSLLNQNLSPSESNPVFHRQQERHLGLDDESKSGKKTRGDSLKRDRREAVSVKVHKVSAGGVGGTALELIYTVRVAGKAVDAEVAAQDMKLVNVGEMTSQLGFPVLTKAERETFFTAFTASEMV